VEPEGRVVEATARIDDFAALAIVDRAPAAAAPNPPARVLALDVDRRRIDVDVESSGAAILATSQPAIPGWRLELDGAHSAKRMRRINGAFLGADVPAGRHRVSFRFAPVSWSVGMLLAAAGATLSVALLVADRRRRRVR
jgi:uncharacterized membrane protein YfhO